MSNLKPPALPVGDKPSWELHNTSKDDEQLKSIPESFVLLKSLKQSRERWLYQTFPKFSTKPKGGKAADVPPALPHTFQIRGRCDMYIGPHIFPETTVYEVTYPSNQPTPAVVPTPTPTPSSNPYWSSTMAYNAQYQQQPPIKITTPQSTNSTVIAVPASATVAGPSVLSPASAIPATPPAPTIPPITHVGLDLIGKVNQAAENDPLLSKLLKLAAGGLATPDQLKTLGLLIQSLDNISFPAPIATPAPVPRSSAALSAPTKPNNDYYQRYPPPVPVVPAKPFDVVIEFRESAGDRWLFPRGSVFWETIPNIVDSRLNPDMTLTTCLSNDGKISECLAEATGEGSIESTARYPVTIRFKEAPLTLSDTIYRWIGGTEANAHNKRQIENIKSFKRLYLGMQIPAGPLLTQLQAACNPSYALKPLRQGPAPPPRAPRPRKPPAEPKKVTKAIDDRNPPAPPQPPPAKRLRPLPPKAVAPPPIRCSSCGQTDVPLIMGGKYCKPCVEAGKHTPMVTPSLAWTPQSFVFTAASAPSWPRTTLEAGSASVTPPTESQAESMDNKTSGISQD